LQNRDQAPPGARVDIEWIERGVTGMNERILKDIYGHLGGIMLTQKLIVHAMIAKGAVDKDILIKILDLTLEHLSAEDRESGFGKPIASLYRMLTRPEREEGMDSGYPDWMDMVRNLPPMGTDTSQG
jgi:hypothetical protein